MTLDKDFYNRADLAELFGKSEATIYRWVRNGRFPKGASCPGGPLWSKLVLQRYLEKGQCSARTIDQMVQSA